MECPHLIKWITFFCKAEDKVYAPSAFQINEYCRSAGHVKCPFLLQTADNRQEGKTSYFFHDVCT